MLDGLSDPRVGLELSRAWMEAGFANGVDVTGQSAWLAKRDDEQAWLSEADVDRAASVARFFGLELRDRVGSEFNAQNDLSALRGRLTYEYKSRFATALVFGLPALLLHGLGVWLAGGATSPRQMLYPWFFELLLVGWACLAAGWPILWQGALSLRGLRMTADLYTSLLVLACFVPSAVGVLGLPLVRSTFLTVSPGPLFHAAMLTMAAAVLQRWMLHGATEAIAGRADWVLRGSGRLLFTWLAVSVAVAVWGGVHLGVAVAMLMPPLVAMASLNPWNPGPSAVLPVAAFAVMLVLGPDALGRSIAGQEVWIAGGFAVMLTAVMGMGWRGISRR
jgi:hypothetical protein